MAVTPTVRIKVSGGRGPRGPASGPLADESVGAQEINGSDIEAIRDKLDVPSREQLYARGVAVTDPPYLAPDDGLSDAGSAFAAAGDGAIVPAGDFYINSAVNAEFEIMDGANIFGPYADTVWPKGLRSENGNYYIASFSSSTNFVTRPLTLHTSNDGVTFKQIATIARDIDGVVWDFGDPSIFYHGGLWYVTFTNYQTDQHDFCVAVSRNLTDWKVQRCKLGTGVYITNGTAPGWAYVFATGPWIWAPKFILGNDGVLYLTCSIRSQADQTTLEGTQPFFRQFISTVTAMPSLSSAGAFSAPVEMQIDGKVGPATASAPAENKLDGSILQRPDGTWAMAIKDDYNKWINLCTAATLASNWTTTKVNALPLGTTGGATFVEGPSLTPFYRSGSIHYRIYADKYYYNHQFYTETDNFLTVTPPAHVSTDCVIRHGRILNIGALPRDDMSAAVDTVTKAALFLAKPPRSDIKAMRALNDLAGFPNLGSFVPDNGVLYQLRYDAANLECTISGLPLAGDAPEGSYFYLAIYAGNDFSGILPCRIRILAGATNFIPNVKDFIIGQHLGTGDTLFRFIMVDGSWRVESATSIDVIAGRTSNDQTLNSLPGYPNINNGNTNWWPMDGRAYFSVGTDANPINIYSLPTTGYPDGAKFYLSPRTSVSAGTIVLKTGAHAHWPADITISGISDNSKHFEIRKIAGKWTYVGK